MHYTEIELIRKHKQNLFLLDKQINDGKLNFEDIENVMDSTVHTNRLDFSIKYMNSCFEPLIGMHHQPLVEEGVGMFNRFFDMELWNIFMPRLVSFFQLNDANAVSSGFQAIKPVGKKDFRLLLTASKIYKKENIYFSMTMPIKMLETSTNKLERVLEQDLFLRKNFERFASLTKKEKEILQLIAMGYSNQEIANMAFTSIYTVDTHRKNINRKLEIRHLSEAYRYASAFDLV